MRIRGWITVMAAWSLVACSGPRPSDAQASTTPWRMPGDRIDSILPMPELLDRFRHGLADPGQLTGGATDREDLARRFLTALAVRDTTTLQSLLVTRAEFAWLLFPEHLYHEPPYELDPEIAWMQFSSETHGGLAKMLRSLGGRPLRYVALACTSDTLAFHSAVTRAWGPCAITWRDEAGAHTGKLFGTIVERDGRSKFMTYASDF